MIKAIMPVLPSKRLVNSFVVIVSACVFNRVVFIYRHYQIFIGFWVGVCYDYKTVVSKIIQIFAFVYVDYLVSFLIYRFLMMNKTVFRFFRYICLNRDAQ